MIQVLVRKDFGPPCKCFRKVPRHGRVLCKRTKDNFIGIWGISHDHQRGRKKSPGLLGLGLGAMSGSVLMQMQSCKARGILRRFFFAILITRCLTIASVCACARARVRSCVRVYVPRSCASVQCLFSGYPFCVIIFGCVYPFFSMAGARPGRPCPIM